MKNQAIRNEAAVALVSPFPPPYGGMAVQAEKLAGILEQNGRLVYRVKVNQPLGSARWTEGIPGLRTAFRTVLYLRALNRALDHCGFVYILSGFFGYFFWVSAPAILLAKARRKRVVLSARGGAAEKFFRRYRPFVRPFIALLDGVTAPSRFLQQQFTKTFGVPVSIVPNIADIEQFTYRERQPLQPKLLCARNLETIYNVGCTVRAYARVRQKCPHASLVLAGDGPERPRIERLCGDLNLGDSVIFLGQVPHEQMPSVYDRCDILVNSSNVDNTPGVILEAFASGLPVVSTRTGGIPFLVEHNVTGLLVDIDDEEALAGGVFRLLNEPLLARGIAAKARDACRLWSGEAALRAFSAMAPANGQPPIQVITGPDNAKEPQ